MAVTDIGIREQAAMLARANRESNPAIEKVFWFPHPAEIRLVETTPDVPSSDDGRAYPFYWPSAPDEGLTVPSGIALIRPEELRRVLLPATWGGWDAAVELE